MHSICGRKEIRASCHYNPTNDFIYRHYKITFGRCILLKRGQVREFAAAADLITAHKKDSTGICFIGKRRFSDFLTECKDSYHELCFSFKIQLNEKRLTRRCLCIFSFFFADVTPKPGPISLLDGPVIGQHSGLFKYTIGQGARLSGFSERLFVVAKNGQLNTLVVAPGRDHPVCYKDCFSWKEY